MPELNDLQKLGLRIRTLKPNHIYNMVIAIDSDRNIMFYAVGEEIGKIENLHNNTEINLDSVIEEVEEITRTSKEYSHARQ